ncbi:MAG: hypothetical protein WEE89_23135 [Gemmatimonadota bacterium]
MGASLTGLLRTMSLAALVVGACGSLVLMLRAGTDTPTLLLVVFVVWVLSPFIAASWAMNASKRWSARTQTTLYCMTLVIALGSLAVYGKLIRPPAGSPAAFVFVAVPPVSWLLLAVPISIAALRSRKR